MPAGAVKTKRDEHLWSLAKRRAKEEGRTGDYAYIMGIYQHMKGEKSEGRIVLDLVKAAAAPAASSTSKAPAGFMPIPNSKHGGYHKKEGASYIYWYPGIGITRGAHAGDTEAGGKAAKVKGAPAAPAAPAQGQAQPQAGKQPPAPAPSSKVATGAGGPASAAAAPAKAPAAPAAAPAASAATAPAAPAKAEVITDPTKLPPGFNELDKKTRAVMTADWENVQQGMQDRFGPPEPYKGDLGKAIDAHLDELGREGYIIPSNVEKAKAMMGQMVKHGKAAGIDEKKLAEVMNENVRKLAQQETESARRTLGDHGVRHLSSNAKMSDAIFDQLEKGGVKLDPRDRFMAYQAWIDHDMGYAIPAIAQGGFAVKDNYHPQASAVLVMQQRKKYEDLFGADKFDTYVQAVANHSGTAVDWKGDHFGSAIRLADNTHLFSDKMPEVLFDRPEAVECLVKIRLIQEMFPKPKGGERDPADKAKVKAMIGGVKKALTDEIDRRTDLPRQSKALLHQAAQELGELTPTFLISRLAGRSPEFNFKNGDMDVVIEQSDARQTIGEVFGDDEEDKQFAKLLKDYGTDPKAILGGHPPPEAHIGDKGNGINFKWEPGAKSKDPAEELHTRVMKVVRGHFDAIQKMSPGPQKDKALDEFFGSRVAKALRELLSLTGELDDWLEKAEQLSLFGGSKPSAKPPGGYEPVPASKHGGFRKRTAKGYVYWYPDKGEQAKPHPADRAMHHRAMVEHHREKEREHKLATPSGPTVESKAAAKRRLSGPHPLAAKLHAGAANLHDWAVAALEAGGEGGEAPAATIRHLKDAGKGIDPEEAARSAEEWGERAHAASEKANQPEKPKRAKAKPSASVDSLLTGGGLPSNVIIKNPAGTYSFTGRVDVRLGYEKKDGSPLTQGDMDAISEGYRLGSPGMVMKRLGIGVRTFKTHEEAMNAARELGQTAEPLAPAKRTEGADAREIREMREGAKSAEHHATRAKELHDMAQRFSRTDDKEAKHYYALYNAAQEHRVASERGSGEDAGTYDAHSHSRDAQRYENRDDVQAALAEVKRRAPLWTQPALEKEAKAVQRRTKPPEDARFKPVPGDRWGGRKRVGVPKGQEYYQYDKDAFIGAPPTEAEFRKMKAAMALETAIENTQIAHAEMGQRPPSTHPVIEDAERQAKAHNINRRNYQRFATQATAFLLHLYDHGWTGGLLELPYGAVQEILGKPIAKSERIPGGMASGKKPEDFDQEQLAAGVKIEMEHTKDPGVAREIAMDHLTEDKDYYRKLRRMEAKKSLSDADLQDRIVAFLKRNPKPEDFAVHAFATKLGVNKHHLEEVIYQIASGKIGKSAMAAVAARTGRERPSPYRPMTAEEKKPGLLHRIAAKLGKRPPGSGWSPIPGGKKGGFRKMGAGGYVYWYPGMKAEGGTQKEAEAHVAAKEKEAKTEEAKKQILHHEKHSDKWRERAATRHEQGHPREAVEAARDKMHEHANAAAKIRKEHGLEHWRRSDDEQPDLSKGLTPELDGWLGEPELQKAKKVKKAKAPLITLDKEGVGKMPKLKPYVEPPQPALPEARKSVRMGSVDLELSADEAVCKALDAGMELGIGVRHYDQPRKLNVDMMKGTIYQGEAALPNQADDREAFMRQQVLEQTVEEDAAGNQGNGGDPAWFGFVGAAVPPTTVIDDTDPMVRQAFRKRD